MVAEVEELMEMQAGVREIYVDSAISDYIVRLVNATRSHPDVYLGASPRGSLALYRAGQAYAAVNGRDFVIPDDIKVLAEPALAHRLIVRTAATIRDVAAGAIVRELLDVVPVDGRPWHLATVDRCLSDLPAVVPRTGRRWTGSMMRRLQVIVAGRASWPSRPSRPAARR